MDLDTLIAETPAAPEQVVEGVLVQRAGELWARVDGQAALWGPLVGAEHLAVGDELVLAQTQDGTPFVIWPAAPSTGEPGPEGPAGPTGPPGSQGPVGAQGPTGQTGAQGVKGDTGTTGAQGPQGAPGTPGAQGPKGDTGTTGSTGQTGAQGPQGVKGDTGTTGAQGVKGDAGAQGIQGPQGIPGPSGASTFVAGVGAPTAGVGADGAVYLDTVNGRMYGPKAAGAWPATPLGRLVTDAMTYAQETAGN